MKDQIRLLRDCFHNEIPAVVFQGNDSCAGEIINEVKAYQQESLEQVQLPQLTHTEAELIREEMRQKDMVY